MSEIVLGRHDSPSELIDNPFIADSFPEIDGGLLKLFVPSTIKRLYYCGLLDAALLYIFLSDLGLRVAVASGVTSSSSWASKGLAATACYSCFIGEQGSIEISRF